MCERDRLGDNFAIMVADRNIIFHRMTKLNFLLPEDRRTADRSLHGGSHLSPGRPVSRWTTTSCCNASSTT